MPPSWPLIWMMSAFALATPDATVPIPACATSLTLTLADGAACRCAGVCLTQVHATVARSAPSDQAEVRSIEQHGPEQTLPWPSKVSAGLVHNAYPQKTPGLCLWISSSLNVQGQQWLCMGGLSHLVEVIDELRQVLNGVDVMVRRRGDERHSGLAAPQVGNVGAHLLGWQLPSLTFKHTP